MADEIKTTSSGAAFAKAFGEKVGSVQKSILASALVGAVVEVIFLASTSGQEPSWIKTLPCTYQTSEVKDEITKVGKAIAGLQGGLEIVPMLIMIVAIGIKVSKGQLTNPSSFPFRGVVVAWLWTTGSMLGLYTFVNVKELTSFKAVSEKSCKVAVSKLFYPLPPSASNDIKSFTHNAGDIVRETAQLYFSNDEHKLAKLDKSDLVSVEEPLRSISTGANMDAITDDALHCDQSSDTAKNPLYRSLYEHTTPNRAIIEYCQTTASAAMEDDRDGLKSGWPVELAEKHYGNIVNSMVLGEYACDKGWNGQYDPVTNQMVYPSDYSSSSTFAKDSSLKAEDVCEYFTSKASLDDVPAAHRIFLGSGYYYFYDGSVRSSGEYEKQKSAFLVFKRQLEQLAGKADREAACALFQTLDPSTGDPNTRTRPHERATLAPSSRP